MKNNLIGLAVLAVLAGCGGADEYPVANAAPTPPVNNQPPPIVTPPPPVVKTTACFHLFESLLTSNNPDFSLYGFTHIRVYDPQHEPYGILSTDAKDVNLVDWENQPNTTLDDALVWARQSGYQGTLSFYAMLPKRDYWRAISPVGSAGYVQWQGENDALKPMVSKVDAIYPSLYTFYPDVNGWVTYAKANMAEGRRIAPSKKMYPYLWYNYHGNGGADTANEIPADFWLTELRTVRDSGADGVVIWGGWDFETDKATPWNDNSEWWAATKQFIAETNICK